MATRLIVTNLIQVGETDFLDPIYKPVYEILNSYHSQIERSSPLSVPSMMTIKQFTESYVMVNRTNGATSMVAILSARVPGHKISEKGN